MLRGALQLPKHAYMSPMLRTSGALKSMARHKTVFHAVAHWTCTAREQTSLGCPCRADAILEDIRYRRLDPDWGAAESFALAKLFKDSRPSWSDPEMYVR